MRFRSFNFRELHGFGIVTPAREIDEVNLLRMDINFLPQGTEIVGGRVDLVINDVLKKQFLIFPQIDTNPADGSVGHPYIVIATNFVQTPKNRFYMMTFSEYTIGANFAIRQFFRPIQNSILWKFTIPAMMQKTHKRIRTPHPNNHIF
jgi:hypothetical protein